MMSLITLRNLTTAMIINSFEKDYFKSLESSWTRIKNSKKPVYIYGMGGGCEKILSQFKRLDIKIDGIFASDDFVRGQSFAGGKCLRAYSFKLISEFYFFQINTICKCRLTDCFKRVGK